MLSSVTITRASEVDISTLVALVNSAYRGDASRQGWTTEAQLLDGQRTDAEDIRDLLHGAGAAFLQARNEAGYVVGSVYVKEQKPDLYMGMLSVSPTLQGAGLGKRLMAAAEEHAQKAGCSSLLISVISVRHELLAWYERHGFRRTGETVAFPADTRFGVPKQELELLLLRKEIQAQ
jgi:ribosomal protein S18 acetylase RimI-like enzyme